ncbi:hypothetical protein DXG01_009979 [Tephrocybe rancida]|nr:hypothetical protein DXG01_009979 [Tephrocybe rancida]
MPRSGHLISTIGPSIITAETEKLSYRQFQLPIFCKKAYNSHPCLTHTSLDSLTHGPPSRILDLTRTQAFAGCADLRKNLPRLRPRLHVFGHIHESRGAHIHAWGLEGDDELPEVKTFDGDSEDDDMDDLDVHLDEEAYEFEGADTSSDEEETGSESRDGHGTRSEPETVFVNAATYPTGKRAWRRGHRIPFGGPGFQPVVVDLQD